MTGFLKKDSQKQSHVKGNQHRKLVFSLLDIGFPCDVRENECENRGRAPRSPCATGSSGVQTMNAGWASPQRRCLSNLISLAEAERHATTLPRSHPIRALFCRRRSASFEPATCVRGALVVHSTQTCALTAPHPRDAPSAQCCQPHL